MTLKRLESKKNLANNVTSRPIHDGTLFCTPCPYIGAVLSLPLKPPPPSQHVERTFRDESGAVRRHDSGFLLVNMDRNSPRSLSAALPELAAAANTGQECETELYCGVPYYYPFRRRV